MQTKKKKKKISRPLLILLTFSPFTSLLFHRDSLCFREKIFLPAFFCLPWRFFRFFVVVLFVLICVLNGVFFLLAFFFRFFFCKLCSFSFRQHRGERNK